MQSFANTTSAQLHQQSAAPQIRTLSAAAAFFFRHPSPQIIATKLILVASVRLLLGGFRWWDLLIVAAVAIYWPFQEWFAHIFLLHMKPFTLFGKKRDTAIARVHRDHHRRPWNIRTAFLPPRFLLIFAIPINIAFWFLITPSTELACTGIAAFTAMSLVYEWTHYLTHTGYRARSRFYRRIWRNHRLHHFKNEHLWHSFVFPAIDHLFRTAPDQDSVDQSPTCRTLGIGGDGLAQDE